MRKILIIDDEAPTLTMFRMFLETYGYQVLTAGDGEQGVALFKKEKPPVVLTDIKMPQMDGIEVLRQIKALEPRTQVIVITGHGDMDLAIQALNLDATDFINKPIQRRALEQALKRAEERLRLALRKEEAIKLERSGQAAVIRIQGVVNAASEDPVQQAYQQARQLDRTKIVISFAESASINGAGLAVLAQVLLDAKKEGIPMAVTAPSISFKELFDIAGISKLAPIHDSESAALADAGSAPKQKD
jgi:anti-anti-sigma factor